MSCNLLAQESDLEQRILKAYLQKAEEFTKKGEHEKAAFCYIKVFESIEVLPGNLCFYYAKNLYQRQKFENSILFFEKYITLKGDSGIFYTETIKLLDLAKEQAPNHDIHEHIDHIGCEKIGKVICPVCGGSEVIITYGKFDPVYQTCPYEHDNGFMSCGDFKLLLTGQLHFKEQNKESGKPINHSN